MFLKNLGRGITASLLSLVIFSALLSALSSMDNDNMFESIFSEIFENSNPTSQHNTLDKFNQNCKLITSKQIQDVSSALELCSDKDKMAQLKKSCNELDAIRNFIAPDELEQLTSACNSIDDIEEECSKMGENVELDLDMQEMAKTCIHYETNEISDSEFFTKIALSFVPKQDDVLNEEVPMYKLLIIIEFIQEYWLWLMILLIIILLFLHLGEYLLFYERMGKIIMGIGIMIIIPYIFIKLYIQLNPVDTGFILDAITSGSAFRMENFMVQSIKTLFPLIMLKTFSIELIVVSIIFIVIGFIIKIASRPKIHKLNPQEKRINKAIEDKKNEKNRSI